MVRTTLVVAEQPARLSTLALSLRQAGHTVVTSPSGTALDTLERVRPNIVVLDGRFTRRHAIVLPADRLLRAGVRWIFLTEPPPEAELEHWSHVLAERGRAPTRVSLPRAADAGALLEPLLAATTPPVQPARPAGPPSDAEAAAFLVGLWARGATGVVSAPIRNLSATLFEGEAVDEDARRTLVRMLYEGGLTFHRADLPRPVAPKPLAPELWEATRRCAQPALVLEKLDHLLVERPAGRRVQELPLPPDLARLLGIDRDRRTIRELCGIAGVSAEGIAGPLSALVRIGFFHLRPTPTMPPTRSFAPPAPPARTAAPPPVAAVPREQIVLQRLEREWRVLSEAADDRVVLGIPEGASPELVETAIERQKRRYAELLSAGTTNPAIQDLARRILDRVELASQNLRSGKVLTPESVSQHDVAFRQGLRAMEREAWPEACQWFRSARLLEPRSALYVGHLGWAIYNNTQMARESRRNKALELLLLADASAEPIPDLQVYLAAVEAESGEIDRAFDRINRVIRSHPQHRAARELDAKLRAAHSR